jgi:hypothetical protein
MLYITQIPLPIPQSGPLGITEQTVSLPMFNENGNSEWRLEADAVGNLLSVASFGVFVSRPTMIFSISDVFVDDNSGDLFIAINARATFVNSITTQVLYRSIGQIYRFKFINNQWQINHINGISRGIIDCAISSQSIDRLNNRLYIIGASYDDPSLVTIGAGQVFFGNIFIGYIDLITNSYINLRNLQPYGFVDYLNPDSRFTSTGPDPSYPWSSAQYDSVNNNIYYALESDRPGSFPYSEGVFQFNMSTLQTTPLSLYSSGGFERLKGKNRLAISIPDRKLYLSGSSEIYRYNINGQSPYIDGVLRQTAGNLDISPINNLYVASKNGSLFYKNINNPQ